MTSKQLSVFLENKKGRFTDVSKILGDAQINMTAFTVSENSDFGILRLIVSEPEKALELLRNNLFGVSLTDVVCLQCDNTPGSLAKAMNFLNKGGVYIEYMYAFGCGEIANVIIRADDMEKCIKILTDNNLKLIDASKI